MQNFPVNALEHQGAFQYVRTQGTLTLVSTWLWAVSFFDLGLCLSGRCKRMSRGCTEGSCACSREIINLTGSRNHNCSRRRKRWPRNHLGHPHPSASLPFPVDCLSLPRCTRQQLFRWLFQVPEVPGSEKAPA